MSWSNQIYDNADFRPQYIAYLEKHISTYWHLQAALLQGQERFFDGRKGQSHKRKIVKLQIARENASCSLNC